MFLTYIKDAVLRWFALNRIFTSTWVATFPNGQVYMTLATAAISRVQNGIKLTDAATGNKTMTAGAGNALLQAASVVCYYIVTMTADDTAAFKIYKGVDGRDQFPELGDALEDNEIPLGCLKVTTASTGTWAALTDNWNDAEVSAKVWSAFTNGMIVVDKPSDLTFGTAV
jgi:hypothetical protein